MAKSKKTTQEALSPIPDGSDPQSMSRFLKENMPGLMSIIEATDTKGPPIIRLDESNLRLKFIGLKKALMDPKHRDQAVDEILTDLLVAAYQDKVALSTIVPAKERQGDVPVLRSIQRMRQSADKHLIEILKAFREIKRPPVQVVVRQADQINVGEQINQADQQVNIAKNEQSAE